MSDMKDDTSVSMILGINALGYQMPPDLSVAVSHADTNQFFQGSSFAPGSNGSCIWNTGASFVDPKNCYLVLEVKNETNGTGEAWFGKDCSAANLINRMTISSRSGVIIEQIANVNVLTLIRQHYEINSTQGAALSMSGAVSSSDSWATGVTRRFCIPLTLISPWFASIKMLIPSALASGLKFEFLWESAAVALCTTAVTGSDAAYTITGARMTTSNYTLSDVVLRNLNQSAASTGLEMIGSTYFSQSGARSTSVLNVDISKSVSRALSAIYVERDDSVGASISKIMSKALSDANYVTELQYRCGSLYFPQASIRTIGNTNQPSAMDLYQMTVQSFGWSGSMATFARFLTDSSVFAVNLERSTVMELAGIPLSNSRMLNLNASWNAVPSTPLKYNLFLKHAVLIRVFANSISVEI